MLPTMDPSSPARLFTPTRVLFLALILATGACSLTPSSSAVKPATLSPTLAPMLFKEEGTLVLMTAGVNATRFHGSDPFIPLEVWLANKGITPYLSLTRESFYLMDTFGRRYGMAGVEEVRKMQPSVSLDRRLAQTDFNLFKFSAYHHVESEFFPGLGAAAGLLHDHVDVPRYSFMNDMLYFPRPEGELNGGIFELHLQAKQLTEDVFVVFEVPLAK